MSITLSQIEATTLCLEHNIPFALYALPNREEACFIASVPDKDGSSKIDIDRPDFKGLFMSRFASDDPLMAGVSSTMDEAGVLKWYRSHKDTATRYRRCIEQPSLMSTRRVSYDEAFKILNKRLKKSGGKVVLSRHRSLFTTDHPADVAMRYFNNRTETFRYLCYTPDYGLWLGATPEIFLEKETGSNRIQTMALAGTMSNDCDEPWDEKNFKEHALVTAFIIDTLETEGLKVTTGNPFELFTGSVRHLCTPIEAEGDINLANIITNLNPTPAVAGWPRFQSLAEIDAFETHQRRCYGGLVGVKDDNGIKIFVNLRCAFLAPAKLDRKTGWVYNLYAGGGLMASSNVDDEWTETNLKMESLYSCIDKTIDNPVEAQFL